MKDWEQIRRRVAIGGQIRDESGRPAGGVQVKLTGGPAAFADRLKFQARRYGASWAKLPERLDRTQTASDGFFSFIDLPEGHYTVTAVSSQIDQAGDQAQIEATVAHLAEGRVEQPLTELTLTSTSQPPPFEPTQLPDCRLWLTGAALVDLGDGDPVARWPDRSGQARQVEQPNTEKQPRYRANGIGNQPALRFDGQDDFLSLAWSGVETDHTFVFVYDHRPGRGNNFLFDIQRGPLALDCAARRKPHPIRWNDGKWHTLVAAEVGCQILSLVFSKKQLAVFRNGSGLGTETYQPRPLGGKSTIGSHYNGRQSFFSGALAECIYYQRALEPAERQRLEQYLSQQYSITLAQD